MIQTFDLKQYLAEFEAVTKQLNKEKAQMYTTILGQNRRIHSQNVVINKQKATIRSQAERIKELEAKLSKYEDPEPQKNSTNSSTPPSKENIKTRLLGVRNPFA